MSLDNQLKTERVLKLDRGEIQPGTVLQNRYRLLRMLDSGGMGQAWLAEDSVRKVDGNAAQVVIKLLPPDLRRNPDASEDFRREYGKVWLLSHPHICKLFDMGEDEHVGCFQVMQFLPGQTVRQLLRQHPGGPGHHVVVRILTASAQALDYAHNKRLIHRDIKPENVMYDAGNGDVHLIDFGLAAEIRNSQARYSRGVLEVNGTPRYMAPEQWQGRPQDAACDQWALGVLAWELLTGEPPFHGNGMALGFAVCQAPLPQLPGNLAALQPVFERVLQKEPANRFASCMEFVTALQQAMSEPKAAAETSPVAKPAPAAQPPSRPALLAAPFSRSNATAAQTAWGDFLKREVQWQDEFSHELRLIPAGQFTMGHDESLESLQQAGFVLPPTGDWTAFLRQEGPAHSVTITRPFYLGTGPVTRGQFAAFVRASGYKTEAESDGKGGWGYIAASKSSAQKPEFTWRQTGFEQTDEHPVVNVTWNDAMAYVTWLNEQSRVRGLGRKYRLPTEAEWEYACRAGTTTRFFTGDTLASLEGFANVQDASFAKAFPTVDFTKWQKFEFDDGSPFTSVAGRYSSNPFGLYDMHGNVWDWCNDWYDGNYYGKSPKEDPAGPSSGSSRVLSGGGWFSVPVRLRSSCRYGLAPDYRYYYVSFRVLLESE